MLLRSLSCVGFLLFVVWFTSGSAISDDRGANQVDFYGDPLPSGAVARLGTLRFRAGYGTRLYFLGKTRNLVSRDETGRVRFWDLDTGRVLREINVGRSSTGLAVSSDGNTIAAVGHEFDRVKREYHCTLKVFDARSTMVRKEIEWIEPSGGAPTALAMSPDRTSVLTASGIGKLRLWDIASGDELLDYDLGRRSVDDLAFSPDGEWLAIGGRRESYLWQFQSGDEPKNLPAVAQGVMSVVFSPDGKWLATGSSEDNGVRLWNVKTQKLQRRLRGQANYHLATVAFSPDGGQLLVPRSPHSKPFTGGIEVWDVKTGKTVRTLAAGTGFGRFAVSRDGKRIAAISGDSIKVIDVDSGKQIRTEFAGPTGDPYNVVFSPDGRSLVSSDTNGSIRYWSAQTGEQKRVMFHERGRMVRALDVSPDGKLLASSSLDDTVRLWDLATGKLIYRLYGHGELGGHREVRFTPDGKQFVAWGDDMECRRWDVRTGKALAENRIRPSGVKLETDEEGVVRLDGIEGHAMSVNRSDFSHDGKRLLMLILGKIYEFDATSGKEIRHYKFDDQISDFRTSRDGKLLVTVEGRRAGAEGPDGRVPMSYYLRVRAGDTHKVLRDISLSGRYFRYPTLSHDGKLVALFGSGYIGKERTRLVGVWDTRSGKQTHLIKLPSSNLFTIAFSPDGGRLATSHDDTTILVWDLKSFAVAQ